MSLKDVVENSNVSIEDENLVPAANFIRWLDEASKDELIEVRKACKSYSSSYSGRMGFRSIANTVAQTISKEIKKF